MQSMPLERMHLTCWTIQSIVAIQIQANKTESMSIFHSVIRNPRPKQPKHPLPPLPLSSIRLARILLSDLHPVLVNAACKRPREDVRQRLDLLHMRRPALIVGTV